MSKDFGKNAVMGDPEVKISEKKNAVMGDP
jgi:hypothetical protein